MKKFKNPITQYMDNAITEAKEEAKIKVKTACGYVTQNTDLFPGMSLRQADTRREFVIVSIRDDMLWGCYADHYDMYDRIFACDLLFPLHKVPIAKFMEEDWYIYCDSDTTVSRLDKAPSYGNTSGLKTYVSYLSAVMRDYNCIASQIDTLLRNISALVRDNSALTNKALKSDCIEVAKALADFVMLLLKQPSVRARDFQRLLNMPDLRKNYLLYMTFIEEILPYALSNEFHLNKHLTAGKEFRKAILDILPEHNEYLAHAVAEADRYNSSAPFQEISIFNKVSTKPDLPSQDDEKIIAFLLDLQYIKDLTNGVWHNDEFTRISSYYQQHDIVIPPYCFSLISADFAQYLYNCNSIAASLYISIGEATYAKNPSLKNGRTLCSCAITSNVEPPTVLSFYQPECSMTYLKQLLLDIFMRHLYDKPLQIHYHDHEQLFMNFIAPNAYMAQQIYQDVFRRGSKTLLAGSITYSKDMAQKLIQTHEAIHIGDGLNITQCLLADELYNNALLTQEVKNIFNEAAASFGKGPVASLHAFYTSIVTSLRQLSGLPTLSGICADLSRGYLSTFNLYMEQCLNEALHKIGHQDTYFTALTIGTTDDVSDESSYSQQTIDMVQDFITLNRRASLCTDDLLQHLAELCNTIEKSTKALSASNASPEKIERELSLYFDDLKNYLDSYTKAIHGATIYPSDELKSNLKKLDDSIAQITIALTKNIRKITEDELVWSTQMLLWDAQSTNKVIQSLNASEDKYQSSC